MTRLAEHVEVEHRWPGLDWGVLARVVGPVLVGMAMAAGISNVIRTADDPAVVGLVAIPVMLAVPGGWLLVLRRRWQRYGRVFVDDTGLVRITRTGRRRVIPLADIGAVHRHPSEDRSFVVLERRSGKRPWAFDTNEWPLDDAFWVALGTQPSRAEPVAKGIVDIEDRYRRVRKIGFGVQGGALNAWVAGTIGWVMLCRIAMAELDLIDFPV